MSDREDKLKELLKIKDKLIDAVTMEFAKGVQSVDVAETGAVIDMIYDIAKAEKNCYEAEYYKAIVEAMEEAEEEHEHERYGYTRYPKRPMPWYKPMVDREPYIDAYLEDPEFGENMRMGYSGGRGGNTGGGRSGGRGGRSGGSNPSGGNSGGDSGGSGGRGGGGRSGYSEAEYAEEELNDMMMRDMRYGKPFNDYRTSKRHYTQSKSQTDKNEMTSHANEHIADMISTTREMWKDADAELKKQMKASLTGLLGEMNG